jgi:hypothetical protein
LVHIFDQYFPGIAFGWTPSGPEKIVIAKSRGCEFPPVLREHFEKSPAEFEGHWDGPDGVMKLHWNGEAGATALHLEFWGDWEQSDALWVEVLPTHGWQIEYHSTLIPPGEEIRR